ncbi:hypothetical protein C8R44DRAFT_817935, partial [Mycena epipterygia]
MTEGKHVCAADKTNGNTPRDQLQQRRPTRYTTTPTDRQHQQRQHHMLRPAPAAGMRRGIPDFQQAIYDPSAGHDTSHTHPHPRTHGHSNSNSTTSSGARSDVDTEDAVAPCHSPTHAFRSRLSGHTPMPSSRAKTKSSTRTGRTLRTTGSTPSRRRPRARRARAGRVGNGARSPCRACSIRSSCLARRARARSQVWEGAQYRRRGRSGSGICLSCRGRAGAGSRCTLHGR